jgi:hypothetical protein
MGMSAVVKVGWYRMPVPCRYQTPVPYYYQMLVLYYHQTLVPYCYQVKILTSTRHQSLLGQGTNPY